MQQYEQKYIFWETQLLDRNRWICFSFSSHWCCCCCCMIFWLSPSCVVVEPRLAQMDVLFPSHCCCPCLLLTVAFLQFCVIHCCRFNRKFSTFSLQPVEPVTQNKIYYKLVLSLVYSKLAQLQKSQHFPSYQQQILPCFVKAGCSASCSWMGLKNGT